MKMAGFSHRGSFISTYWAQITIPILYTNFPELSSGLPNTKESKGSDSKPSLRVHPYVLQNWLCSEVFSVQSLSIHSTSYIPYSGLAPWEFSLFLPSGPPTVYVYSTCWHRPQVLKLNLFCTAFVLVSFTLYHKCVLGSEFHNGVHNVHVSLCRWHSQYIQRIQTFNKGTE